MKIKSYILLFFSIFILKIVTYIFFIIYGYEIFGGGNDGDYYDAYALGQTEIALNSWSYILRTLNEIGIYSRNSMRLILMLLGFLIIPFMVAKLSIVNDSLYLKRIFWFTAVYVSIYPTMAYYTLDIYRDVFMVFCFLLGLFSVRAFIETNKNINRIFFIFSIILISLLLYSLRIYLGIAFFASFLFYHFFDFKKGKLLISFFIYLIIMNILFATGFLNPIFAYREIFSNEMEGGSNLGIVFDSIPLFSIQFLKSFFYQIVGLFFSGTSSIIVFMFESAPILLLFIYLVKNRKYSNKFINFLIMFFVMYSSVWVLGNDNLGTAVRLRIYNYLSIIIGFLIVYQRKNIQLSTNKV
jgi:hypothetical protein